ncbi:hypothetical protein GCM10011390_02440 [Aureimonas endophytica]|uniref:DUF707 domain-containing protein n=1 Tax=Aureimonas endophytica TaxID=2027858 RepID=A0A916ZBY0_9HYPH|nr:DUF707 domain-containing protein [Aureimonas endophytica]GGD87246.1 hypothetical protein GCM10011390_02440 [Aureimonas endophytica]
MGVTEARRFLVVGRVGDNSLHRHWVADTATERTWDLQLNAYGHDESKIQNGDLPPVIDRGTKWDSLVRHFRAYPELLDRYDYVMLPDDDLMMDVRTINRIFEIVVQYDLTMAQPSLSYESYISYPIVLRSAPFRLRYTTFIESMSCCMKTSFLKRLLPMFEEHFTGWGTDLVWTMLMEDPAYRAAIIDEVSMVHTRPLYVGPIYKTFAAQSIDPQQEIVTLRESFENTPDAMLIYGGVLRNGRKVDGAEARLRNGLQLIASSPRSPKPYDTFRFGAGSLLRIVTRAGFRPEQLRPVAGSRAALWFGKSNAS